MCTDDTVYSVTIVTNPSKGPFNFEQTVQFSCLVEPPPPEPVTYQWSSREDYFGGYTYNSQSFNKTYYSRNLRYCWYSCRVFQNQTIIGSSDKFVEVQGEFLLLKVDYNKRCGLVV